MYLKERVFNWIYN